MHSQLQHCRKRTPAIKQNALVHLVCLPGYLSIARWHYQLRPFKIVAMVIRPNANAKQFADNLKLADTVMGKMYKFVDSSI